MKELKYGQIHKIDEKRDYFSMVPHYIADHSTANGQALYLQIKRYAGEDGVCFATEQTLMKKMGIGKKAYDKAKKYLLSKGWIIFTGRTNGKTRPINTYRPVDIWEINHNFYEKINAESNISKISQRHKSQKKEDKSQKQYNIAPKSNVEEEPLLRRTPKEEVQISEEEKAEIKKIKDGISEMIRGWKLPDPNNNDP